MSWAWRGTLLLSVLAPMPGISGEIPGLPPQLPPFIESDLAVTFSNDFLGRGGSVDDFRTQQIIISAKLSDRWIALLDHSILTLGDAMTPGRIDQLSASLGYQMFDSGNDRGNNKLLVGIGVRNVGNFAGERMQNGFHRLVGSDIENLPYTDANGTDATAWFDADHYRRFGHSSKTGYWLRASSLLTSGGQWDSSAGLYAVTSPGAVDIWLGLRRDWRTGYDDPVLKATAAAEDDLAIVFGVRFGALVLETVQQLNNDASYGQLRLVSTGVRATDSRNEDAHLGLEAGFLMPDIQVRLAGRYRQHVFTGIESSWRETVMVAISYGEPQYGNNSSIYVRSGQFDIGLDFERTLSTRSDWLSVYGSASGGWRNERLIGAGAFEGETSESVGRAILSVGTGFRINAAGMGERWNFRIQLGLIGRLPVQDAEVQIDGMLLRVQKPALDLMLGMSFDFD